MICKNCKKHYTLDSQPEDIGDYLCEECLYSDFHIEYPKDKNRTEPIQFTVNDNDGEVIAEVWGSEPWKDIQVECNHPEGYIEYGDENECGECPVCGSQCYWHYQESADDGYTIQERIVDEWLPVEEYGGMIGRYLNNLRKEF